MPSPFPGMDPYIEGQAWGDFRHSLIVALSEAIVAQVRPRYVARIEARFYLEHLHEDEPAGVDPDLTIVASPGDEALAEGMNRGPATDTVARVTLTLPIPERQRDLFLTVRERESMEVVTVIEVLSPSNKRPGSDGRREYLSKRESVLVGPAHLIELDLLRGGERLPTVETLPPADYYAFVSRKRDRPKVEVYHWSLRQQLPLITVPLAGGDPEVPLDLQAAFTNVYDRAGYDYSLSYRHPVEPPLGDEDAAWAQQVLTATSSTDPAA